MGKNLELFEQKISQVERAKEVLHIWQNGKDEVGFGVVLFDELKAFIDAKVENHNDEGRITKTQVKIIAYAVVCALTIQYVSFWSPEARRLFQDIVSVCKEKIKIKMTDRTKKVEVENG